MSSVIQIYAETVNLGKAGWIQYNKVHIYADTVRNSNAGLR